jgi:hypothetical protein
MSQRRSFPCSQSDLDQSPDGLGAAGLITLPMGPGFNRIKDVRGKSDCDHWIDATFLLGASNRFFVYRN